PGLVGRGDGSAHALQLPHWIHEMNPPTGFVQQSLADLRKNYTPSVGSGDRVMLKSVKPHFEKRVAHIRTQLEAYQKKSGSQD
ncbi:hypothetical protein, partial [Phaeovulum sp. NW3]|uniref:hypothetical protein n=1 Tax=Phaeovulum sp. NW3 TaxID=2934933 RepID=UPI0020211E9F